MNFNFVTEDCHIFQKFTKWIDIYCMNGIFFLSRYIHSFINFELWIDGLFWYVYEHIIIVKYLLYILYIQVCVPLDYL